MILENIWLTVVIDVVICAAAAYAFYVLCRNRASIQSGVTERGFWFVNLGLALIGLYYFIDLWLMFAFSRFMSSPETEAFMHWYHGELSWIVMPVAMALLSSGFTTNVLAVSAVIRKSQESEARYRAVAENAGDWIWETDANLRFSFVSPRFFELFPFRPEDMIGKTRREFSAIAGAHDVDSDESWKRHFREMAEHRPLRDFHISFTPSDGRTRHIVISGNPVFDASGVFQGYRGSGSDRTAEIEARNALEDYRRRFRDLNEGSLQGLLVHSGGELVMANNALAEMFGYSCHMEIVDQGVIDPLLAPQERDGLREHETALLEGRPAPETIQCDCRRKNGSVFRAQLRLKPVEWEGRSAMQIAVLDMAGDSMQDASGQSASGGAASNVA